MAGFTDFLEGKILDHIFTDATWIPPTTLYVGLLAGTPSNDAGGGLTEVSTSGTAYVRQPVVAADMGAITGTAPVTKANTNPFNYPVATADYASGANLTHWGIYDAVSGGNLLTTGLLGTAKSILSGDTAVIPAGGVVLRLGDPVDFS